MKLIDISHMLDEKTPVYPGDFQTTLCKYRTLENDRFNSYLLQTCMHTGTHIDMPMHLTDDGRTAGDFPPERFCGRGVLIDVRGEQHIEMKPEYRERIAASDIVLLLTGWDEKFTTPEYFFAHPVLGKEFADFLLSSGIKMLGMDMPSPDYAPHLIHRALLEHGIFVLENLTRLQDLTGVPRFEVLALPLKIRAEASLVRAVCIV